MSGYSISIDPYGVVLVRQTLNGDNHRYTLTPEQDIAGQPDEIRAFCAAHWTPQTRQVYAAYQERIPSSSATTQEVMDRAILTLKDLHASFLQAHAGQPTLQEYATWKLKEDAARAYLDGVPSDAQKTMIEREAAGDDTPPMALAQVILRKAEAFHHLIGIAGGIKRKADAAIARLGPDADNGAALNDILAKARVAFDQATVS